MIADTAVRVPPDELRALVFDAFVSLGIPEEDAGAVADVLVDANLRGIDSHGFNRVPTYMERVRSGLAGGADSMRLASDAGVLCRIDAGHALGPAVAIRGADIAASRALAHGIALVAIGRSTHFGPAGHYARHIAERGLIAIAITNAPATMAAHATTERFLGTNPIAIAAPLGGRGVFVLDMSSSVVARGKIVRAALLGETLPEGLALDAEGAPTTEAERALEGCVLPLGGPKGSNLALAIAIVCGILAGADFDDEMASMYEDPDRPQNVGHVFIAVDPARLGAGEDARGRLEALVDRFHALRRADPGVEPLLAGELEDRCAEERRRDGIPVPTEELAAFADACRSAGLGALAERARKLADPSAGEAAT